jgi:NAD(P)-dependent dehydrogenase (short-subunit alcohol dehydrogenase family)
MSYLIRDQHPRLGRSRRPGQGGLFRRYKRNPGRRIGTANDIANAVLFAAASTFLTGQTLHIDGGEPLT